MLTIFSSILDKAIAREKFGKNPESLYEPIRYLMAIGGKRLRPTLTLFGYSLYANDYKSVARYAIAVEAFHNFTLMHDDIMDKAPLRRGNPTVHKKWNVNTAILSGDVMLVKVYELFNSLDGDTLKTVLKTFNKCAAEVCEGQQWDMEFERRNTVTESEYLNMIRLKTAVLLGFSLELGAILGKASDNDRAALREFGTNIGIGFQLKDDLLDAYADPKKFGKQVGGDIIANKKTYLLIKALEKAKGKTKSELNDLLLAQKFHKQTKVDSVKRIYDQLDIPKLTEQKVNQYFKKGFQSLQKVSVDNDNKERLRIYAESFIARQS